MLRIPKDDMQRVINKILIKHGFSDDIEANLCARLFTQSTLDGVSSHGIERLKLFTEMIADSSVKPNNKLEKISGFGALERWDGNQGSGQNNAYHTMNRTMELASKHGIGCIGLRNTNHWMRAGNYGWQAAEKGYIGICFTNTKPNLVPWGALEPKIGNNPLVIAMPRSAGHLVIDTSMSQYSYGKMNQYLHRNEQLPYHGGYTKMGELTKDPQQIIEHELALSIGFWKGSGLSILLDSMASMISNGKNTREIGLTDMESDLSQVFIAINPKALGEWDANKLDTTIKGIKASEKKNAETIYYPGERSLINRNANLIEGIPVDEAIWSTILSL